MKIFNAILIVLSFILIGCEDDKPSSYLVRYEIECTSGVSNRILYTNATGNTDRLADAPLPWSKELTMDITENKPYLDFYTEEAGTATISIFVDDDLKETVTESSNGFIILVLHYDP